MKIELPIQMKIDHIHLFAIVHFCLTVQVMAIQRQTKHLKVLKTNGSLMTVERIAECSLEHSATLLTCIKR